LLLIPRTINPLILFSKQISILSDYDFINGDASELKKDLPLMAKDEIGQLARSFALMTEKLTSNIRQLVETTARTEQMQSDLNVARDIQLHSLPRNFFFPPEKKIELHADMIPAREVGGDLYDFFWIDKKKHICIAIGDVVGKGVSAALTMTIAKKLIRSTVLQKGELQSTSAMASYINQILSLDNPDSYYTTLFLGILDVTSGELRYVNCGHAPQPLFTNGGNAPFFRKEVSGSPVGARPGISYKEFAAVLPPGEAILLCTDGVTEAMNEEEQLFGDERLLESFARMQDKPCKEVIDGILREVRAHAGQEPQSDDITMLMIRWGAENKNADVAREQKQQGA
jgi:sigma-B regulation protein RsbU (phosphoserine phosphatase)